MGSTHIGIPKKDNTIRFVSDFTGLNKHVVRHPFPLPSIQETIQKWQSLAIVLLWI